MDDILSLIKKELKGNSIKSVTLDTKIKDINLDSIVWLELIVKLEKHYKIEIEDEELLNIIDIKYLVNLIEGKLGK